MKEKFEPIVNNKEEASETKPVKKISGLKRTLQAIGLAAGVTLGADKAGAQSADAGDAITAGERSSPGIERKRSESSSERHWQELLENGTGGAREAIYKFNEYADYDFAESLLERAAKISPDDAIYFADSYLSAPYGKKILRAALEDLLSNKDTAKEIVAGSILNNFEKIERLGADDSHFFVNAAVEMCAPYQILALSEVIFKVLPQSVAESFFERAVRDLRDEDPRLLLDSATQIVKFLPAGKDFLDKMADELAENGSPNLIDGWYLDKIESIFGKDKVRSIVDVMLRRDPVAVINKLSLGNADIYGAIENNPSPEARAMLELYESELDSDTKEKIATILDQLVFDKHLSVEDAAELVKDDKKFKEILETIKKRPNYIGKISIEELEKIEASQTPETDSDA